MSAMTDSRMTVSFQTCIFALVVIASPSLVWARFSSIVVGSTELAHLQFDRAGSRGLLQSGSVNQCLFSAAPLSPLYTLPSCKTFYRSRFRPWGGASFSSSLLRRSTGAIAKFASGVGRIAALSTVLHYSYPSYFILGSSGTLLELNGPYDFSKLDYSTVTSVCKGPKYDADTCCAPFSMLACNYKPQINDFNSLCPIYFISYLNVAGGYPAGVFVGDGRCNNGNNLCS